MQSELIRFLANCSIFTDPEKVRKRFSDVFRGYSFPLTDKSFEINIFCHNSFMLPPSNTSSKSTTETLEKGVKHVQS